MRQESAKCNEAKERQSDRDRVVPAWVASPFYQHWYLFDYLPGEAFPTCHVQNGPVEEYGGWGALTISTSQPLIVRWVEGGSVAQDPALGHLQLPMQEVARDSHLWPNGSSIVHLPEPHPTTLRRNTCWNRAVPPSASARSRRG